MSGRTPFGGGNIIAYFIGGVYDGNAVKFDSRRSHIWLQVGNRYHKYVKTGRVLENKYDLGGGKYVYEFKPAIVTTEEPEEYSYRLLDPEREVQ